MYPTRYNDEHEITRYFDFVFIGSNEFWNVSDWDLKIGETLADGVVYAIVPDSAADIDKIRKALTEGTGKNDRIVFCLPKRFVDIEKIAFEYKAVLDLKALVDDDDLLSDEYDIYIVSKEIQVLCACDLLNEGWDCPETEVLFMARPTMSKVLYTQQLGRGMRLFDGKESLICLLISSLCFTQYVGSLLCIIRFE